jgi:hypothetical protein
MVHTGALSFRVSNILLCWEGRFRIIIKSDLFYSSPFVIKGKIFIYGLARGDAVMILGSI